MCSGVRARDGTLSVENTLRGARSAPGPPGFINIDNLFATREWQIFLISDKLFCRACLSDCVELNILGHGAVVYNPIRLVWVSKCTCFEVGYRLYHPCSDLFYLRKNSCLGIGGLKDRFLHLSNSQIFIVQ